MTKYRSKEDRRMSMQRRLHGDGKYEGVDRRSYEDRRKNNYKRKMTETINSKSNRRKDDKTPTKDEYI